jgi:Domain of unknown function (DUF1937)
MGTHYGRLVYLASPLTHPDAAVRQERTVAVARACGWLMNNRRDVHFLSPVAHGTPVAAECSLPYEWSYWAEIDECWLSRCDEIWVLCIPGFRESTGVNAEREIAARLGLPCKFVLPQAGGSYIIVDMEPENADR